MKLPSMKYSDRITKSKQIKFGGLNQAAGAKDGELRDMMNLSSDDSPVMATRKKRMFLQSLSAPGGLYSWKQLCWVDGTHFYYDGVVKGTVTQGEKTFASIGPHIVIFPDKCCFNVDTGEFKSMESTWSGKRVTFTNGLRYEEDAAANTIFCEGVNWEDYFQPGDGVEISGCTVHPENNISAIIREIDGERMYFSENIFSLGGDGTEEYTEESALSIRRSVPNLKYVCEHENRLWGCDDTTIYASQPGDIFNWNVFDGLDSDAWALTPGSVGAFTGCVSYRGYVTFFKEDHIYRVYGSIPSNFEVVDSATLGLLPGNAKSLSIAGETLFYMSRTGIMAYTGGVPQPISQAFAGERFSNAVGGSDGLKYYVSMQDGAGTWSMYVYDTQHGLWHKEDHTRVLNFAWWDGNLFYLNSLGEIWITGNIHEPPEGVSDEPQIEWFAEFADFTDEDPNKKGVSKIQIRLDLDEGAEVSVDIQFDSDGVWRPVRRIVSEGSKRSYHLPIIPRRCDHYKLRLSGINGCRIYSMVRESYSGSETRSLPRR